MSWGPGNGWQTREVTASSVATLNSCGTLWHPRPKNNCETNSNVKTTEKNKKQVQMIESVFKELPNTIRKMDWTGERCFGQFTLRGDFWPTCPLKCVKLKYWKID